MVRRGDITKEKASGIAALIQKTDPASEAMVIWAAAPPCQDFSVIASQKGHEGERRRLFLTSVGLMEEIRDLVRPRRFGYLNKTSSWSRRTPTKSPVA